jgi:hypothetical protein
MHDQNIGHTCHSPKFGRRNENDNNNNNNNNKSQHDNQPFSLSFASLPPPQRFSMPTHHPKMIWQTKGKGRNIPKTSHPKTSHPKQPIPFHVHCSSLLYNACSAAIGVPTTLKNDILAIALTNHLIQMTLHWSSSSGG